ncbi:hypothetical protein Poli38472_011461 [Pythium oligandrum]|uniref:Probable pectate lyase F n=1 Tax=Pythium oligandrum TaxID=41045 RepID=A0A8K1CJ61_PYTOL|nr:hypothetical protein Poli38472_011460 [Pythium oligandrum]TMW64581.1 hypothetical protein Poli38472_011461 [Pythium oligandrum]|eukprot:TMW64580.1 hypothetical protein Poli38472_011460 [Pythium oligandrum]
MVNTVTILCAAALAGPAIVNAASLPTGVWPASKGTVTYAAPKVIKTGEVFDGGMKTYERSNVKCAGGEGGKESAVFLVEPGATLKNVIIGKNQVEGVHCEKHDCTIENVWWTDVCEDALSIKGGSASSVSKVIGGGARYADDKVIQQNGPGKVSVDGFYAYDFGKLYRSCGNCKTQYKRQVEFKNVLAVKPKVSIATINTNLGDTATFTNVRVQSTKSNPKVCAWSQGVTSGEPKELGSGPSDKCKYSTSTVTITKISRLLRD